MKKIFSVIALLVSSIAFGSATIGPTFDSWTVYHVDIGSWMKTEVNVTEGTADLSITSNRNVSMTFYTHSVLENANELGRVIDRWTLVLRVNDQPVRFIGEKSESGVITFTPASSDGKTFIINEILKKRNILISSSDGWWFNFSGKGSSKAYDIVMKNRPL